MPNIFFISGAIIGGMALDLTCGFMIKMKRLYKFYLLKKRLEFLVAFLFHQHHLLTLNKVTTL